MQINPINFSTTFFLLFIDSRKTLQIIIAVVLTVRITIPTTTMATIQAMALAIHELMETVIRAHIIATMIIHSIKMDHEQKNRRTIKMAARM